MKVISLLIYIFFEFKPYVLFYVKEQFDKDEIINMTSQTPGGRSIHWALAFVLKITGFNPAFIRGLP